MSYFSTGNVSKFINADGEEVHMVGGPDGIVKIHHKDGNVTTMVGGRNGIVKVNRADGTVMKMMGGEVIKDSVNDISNNTVKVRSVIIVGPEKRKDRWPHTPYASPSPFNYVSMKTVEDPEKVDFVMPEEKRTPLITRRTITLSAVSLAMTVCLFKIF